MPSLFDVERVSRARAARPTRRGAASAHGLALVLVVMPLPASAARAGLVVAWGYNGDGEVSGAPTGSGYTAIARG